MGLFPGFFFSLSLVCKKATDFCVLILCSAILCKVLLLLKSFESLESYVWNHTF